MRFLCTRGTTYKAQGAPSNYLALSAYTLHSVYWKDTLSQGLEHLTCRSKVFQKDIKVVGLTPRSQIGFQLRQNSNNDIPFVFITKVCTLISLVGAGYMRPTSKSSLNCSSRLKIWSSHLQIKGIKGSRGNIRSFDKMVEGFPFKTYLAFFVITDQ